MYPNLNITLAQVKLHLKYFETKQNKVDKKTMLINDKNNVLKHIIDSNCVVSKKKMLGSSKMIENNEKKNSIK